MLQNERYMQIKQKVFDNSYAAEELENAKQSFLTYESVCFDMDEVRQSSLLRKLCDGLQDIAVLPVNLHLPRENELFSNCLLVINTADQVDFKKIIGHAAKDLEMCHFFHMLPDAGNVYSKEAVAVEDGWDLKNLRTAKLLIDGRDRYLVLRPRSLNREN